MAAEKKSRRDVRVRLKQAQERERRWQEAKEKAEHKLQRARTEATWKRYHDAVDKAEMMRRKAARDAGALSIHAMRAEAATRITDRIATTARARQNGTTRVAPIQAKKDKRQAEERRRRLLQANVDADPRTAMGNREMDVIGLGASLRASINHFNCCFRKRTDRTNSRVLAWAKFDELQDKVHRGDLKSPGLEPSIDATRTPDVANAKLEAKGQDAALKAYLGVLMHGVLVDVIFWQRSYVDLVPIHGGVKHIGYMFKRALDMAAAWFGITPDDERGRKPRLAVERHMRQEASPSS